MKKLVFYEIVEIGDYGVVFILKGSFLISYFPYFPYGLGPGFDHNINPHNCQVSVIH